MKPLDESLRGVRSVDTFNNTYSNKDPKEKTAFNSIFIKCYSIELRTPPLMCLQYCSGLCVSTTGLKITVLSHWIFVRIAYTRCHR